MAKTKLYFTKQEESYISAFANARYNSVVQAYAKPSDSKLYIEDRILEYMKENNGYSYRVFSKNGFRFSCGYYFIRNGLHYLMVYTPTKWGIEIPLEIVDEKTGEILYRMRRIEK